MKRLSAALIALGLALTAHPLAAAPSLWGGGESPNMVSSARNLPVDIENTTPLWEVRPGSHQYTIPTIVDDLLLVGTNDTRIERPGLGPTGGGVVMCLDRRNGRTLWQLVSPRYMEGLQEPFHFNHWKCGIASGPVVKDDRVYVTGSRGEVLCLDLEGQADGNDGPFVEELNYMGVDDTVSTTLLPTDGDIVWRFDMITEVDAIPHDICGSTLLLHDGLLYACTSNGIDGAHRTVGHPLAPSLIVLDALTGKLVAVDGEKIGTRMFHGHWSSPVFGRAGERDIIFFGGGDGRLYAFAPARMPRPNAEPQTLECLWTADCNPEGYREKDGEAAPYSRSDDPRTDGPSEIIGTPVFALGRVYVAIGQSPVHGAGQGCLTCIDASTGSILWASRELDRSLGTVSVCDGLVYAVDYSGGLHCFDAATGEPVWKYELDAGAWSASTFVADGKVYASTESNSFYVFRAGRTAELLHKTKLRSMAITPTAVDGILYLPTQNRLIAYPGN